MKVASLELQNLVKMYKTVLGVGPISLMANQGEFIALLGPSGCGKTTTLRCIAGLEVPTEGDILMDGIRINERPPHKREIGIVFQDYALFPHMTVAQNVGFGLRFREVRKDKKRTHSRVMESLDLVNLSGLENRYPSQLSGGQQQRVSLARALFNKPTFLLADEPTGNLDVKTGNDMVDLLLECHKRWGMGIIVSTHDFYVSEAMGHRYEMCNGLLQQIK